MNSAAKKSGLPPLRHQFLIFWACLCLIIIAYTDLELPDSLATSDYLMTFHTAGYVAAHGLWHILYPPAGATSFAGAPFDKQAHALLSHMPSWSVGEYMYMPLSAYIFAPLSMLSPSASLIVWQLISIASLYLGNLFTLGRARLAALATCACFTFIPLVFTLWIGQVGLVFALLPLAGGYHLLIKKRYFLAGLTFSLLNLKPQMLVPALFMVVLVLAGKEIRTLAGLILGSALIALANYLWAGDAICRAWLACLALSDRVYSDPAQGVAVHLATSLPRAILLSQPLASHALVKPVLYLVAFILLLAGLAAAIKLAKSSLTDKEKLTCSFTLGALALPMVVPHLFIYDLGALVPAALMLFFEMPAPEDKAAPLYRGFKRIVEILWLAITVYCLALVSNKSLASPLLLVAVMLLSYMAGIVIVCKSDLVQSKKIQNSKLVD